MSFALACFHFLTFLIVMTRMSWASYYHDGLWAIKFLIVLGLFVVYWWLPVGFLQGYGYFARILSFFFLVYQTIIILSVAYKVNESLVDSYDNGNGFAAFLLILLSIILYGGSATWIVLQYYWFSACWTNVLIISLLLLFAIGLSACVFLKTREDISIFTNGMVILYCCYLSWSALANRPSESCN